MLTKEDRLPLYVVLGIGAAIALGILASLNYPEPWAFAYYPPYQAAPGDSPWWPWWHYSNFWIAVFTLVLTVSTIGLWIVGKRAANAARDQVALARDEFNATHRPKLSLWRFGLDQFESGQVMPIRWLVANTGDVPATILESNATVRFASDPLPAMPPYDGDTQTMGTPVIKPGEAA